MDRPPYNPYLYVKNTGNDVHLVGEESLDGEYDPLMFMDGNNFPWALLVPNTWQPPTEAHRIEEFYPRFTRWRESGGELSRDWYLHDEPWEPEPAANVLVFASDRDGDMELYSLNLDTDEVTQLTSNTFTDKHPDLSADRSKIAFVSDRDGSWGIYTGDVEGNETPELVVNIGGSYYGHPAWSPDGSMIVYDDNFEIFSVKIDGTEKTNLTDTVFTNEYDPNWSPDGSKIAFYSNADGDYDIYTIASDGAGGWQDPVKITDNSVIDQQPCWSPDGTRIAYSSRIDSRYDIFTIDINTREVVNLTNTSGESETSPSWGEEGIAFVRDDEIYTVDPDIGGAPVNITNNSSVDQDPSW